MIDLFMLMFREPYEPSLSVSVFMQDPILLHISDALVPQRTAPTSTIFFTLTLPTSTGRQI